MKRLIFPVIVMLAVFTAAVRLPAQSCVLPMPPDQKMACGSDCCAKMKWCALPQKEHAPVAAPQSVAQQSLVLIAPAVQRLLVQRPVDQPKIDCRNAKIAHKSPPRHALFCTFLI